MSLSTRGSGDPQAPDATATVIDDYVAQSEIFEFRPADYTSRIDFRGWTIWKATRTFRFFTVDDGDVESVEIFRLVLEQVAGFTASNLSVAPNFPDGAIVQIDDDDGTMTVDVEPTGTLEILEEGGPVTLTVKAKTDHLVTEPFPTTVRVRTEDGTATLGNDFVSLGSGSQSRVDLYFVPSDFERTQESLPDNRRYAAEKTVTVTPIDDTLEEHPEDFKLTLSVIEATLTNIARTNLVRTEVPITILNDDVVVPVITVAADAASVTEGEDAVFTVTRSESVFGALTVNVDVRQEGEFIATDGGYEPPAVVEFADGESSATVTVRTADDSVDEANGSIAVEVLASDDYTVGTENEASTMVLDDEDLTVSFGAATYTVTEGEGVEVTVNLDIAPHAAVVIPLTVEGSGGATADDWDGVPSSVTFAAGETAQAFTVTAVDDDVDDDDEGLTLGFDTLPLEVISDSPDEATVAITDNDVPEVTVSFGAASYPVTEGGSVTVTVRLSAPPEREVEVPITVTAGDGVDGTEYSGVPASVTFAATETEQTFTVMTTDDTLDEAQETVTLEFGTLPDRVSAADPTSAEVSMIDDDTPAVSFGAATYTVTEGEGVEVTVNLDIAPHAAVAIPLTAAGSGGATADDWEAPADVTFVAGETTQTFTVTAVDDAVDDDDEGLTLGFGTLPAGVVAGSPDEAVVTIADNDVPEVTVSFGAASYPVTEGDSVTVAVSLSAPPEREVEVPITVTAGEGVDTAEYSGVPATVTFAATDTERTFTVATAEDTLDEAEETVTLEFGTLPDRVSPGATVQAAVTIADDDELAWTVTAAPATIPETGGTATATVTVATGGVTVLDDAHDEAEETMTLVLSNASGARIRDAEAVGTIENSDPIPKAWLARFGRTVADHVVDAVGTRLAGPSGSSGGGSQVTLGGQTLSFGGADAGAESREAEREAAEGLRSLAERMSGTGEGTGRTRWERGDDASEARTMTARELLLGSAFVLSLGGDGDAAGAGDTRWTAWGRAAASRFDGEEDGLILDGDVTTLTLGADAAWSRMLAGVAVAYSTGDGGFRDHADTDHESRGSGRLSSALTSVHPYARLEVDERLMLWGILGYGAGDLDLEMDDGERWATDVTMQMAAAGARGVVVEAPAEGGLELAIRTDAVVQRTESDAASGAAGNLAAAKAGTSRVRLMLEGSRAFAMDGGGRFTPSLEVGLRQDGGDAETGTGVELGGGLSYTDPASGLTVEVKARGLIAHEDADYREWGASASVRIDPGASGRGLSLDVSPAWGAADGGPERLWSVRDARGLAANDEFDPAGRLDAEAGYGLGAFGGRGAMTPYAGLALSEAGDRAWRSGVRWTLGSEVSIGLEGTRREPANDGAPAHGIQFRTIRW